MKHHLYLKNILLTSIVFPSLGSTSRLIDRNYTGAWIVGQNVSTSSGIVLGHAARDSGKVSEYLGIPYAMPPTGLLRFRPPMEFNESSAINASDFGFACMQPGSDEPDQTPQSEDCLTLNIWTKPQVGDERKAILVWVHGGAYSFGSSRAPIYDGQFIADQTDVVVISFNYRFGIFGFPGNPETPANLGLLDMRQALVWIRKNAANFGGDVDRITIFGQSAGAGMTDFYSYAYASDPIANGFILMSATVDGFPALSRTSIESRWFRIAETAGCRAQPNDRDALTDCMRRKTAQQLMSAFSSDDTSIGAVPAFGPGVDDIVVFSDYASRRSAQGGYLIGNNQNEAGLFRLLQPNQTDTYWDDFNDRLYTCAGAARLSRAARDGLPSWRYRYFGDFPNLALSVDPPSGAYHGAELQPLFDTVPQAPIPSTPEEVAVGNYLRGAWAAFAKDPVHGLLSYEDGWPYYEPTRETLVRPAFGNKDGANLTLGNAYDAACR